MRSGKLFGSVAFDRPTVLSDGQGGQEDGWEEVHTCRAWIRNLRGGESVIHSRLQGVQPVVVFIRQCDAADVIDTDFKMRDVRKGQEYNIRTIVLSDNRRYYELTAERGVTV